MGIIINRELKNYFVNPVFLLGAVIIFISIYVNLAPYLSLHYFVSDDEIESLVIENRVDADIMQGYILVPEEEKFRAGLEEIKRTMIEGWEISNEEADKILNDVVDNNETIPEMCRYLEEKYGYYYSNAMLVFEDKGMKQGSADEVNDYMRNKFEDHSYTYYFSKKFIDFTGLFFIFFSVITLSFLYIRDTKKDTWELLHTKPVTAKHYVAGKILGGFFAITCILFFVTGIFTVLCVCHGKQAGFPISYFDLFVGAIFFILPNLFIVVCVYTLIAFIFRNPLPALPLLFLYLIYSNLGSIGADGLYGFQGRILGILVRYPGMLFETKQPANLLINQLFLVLASILLTTISIFVWKRRRRG